MGEEADADWQAGLVEWGQEEAREYYRAGSLRGVTLTAGAIANARYNRDRRDQARTRKPFECRCGKLCRTAGGLAQHNRDKH